MSGRLHPAVKLYREEKAASKRRNAHRVAAAARLFRLIEARDKARRPGRGRRRSAQGGTSHG